MKKLFLITVLLSFFLSFSQNNPDKFGNGVETKLIALYTLTTAQRDALTLKASKGYIIFNADTNVLNIHDGTSWGAITASGGLANIVEDTTPQLGGNLDLNGNDIGGAGNIDISGSISSDSNITTSSFSLGGITVTDIIDDDSFATASATNIPTSESVKAYVDANAGGGAVTNDDYNLWNGNTTEAPSADVIFDKIETVIAGVGTGATPISHTFTGGESSYNFGTTITDSHQIAYGTTTSDFVILQEGVSYTKSGSTITLVGFTAAANDVIKYYPNVAVPATYNASEVDVTDTGGNYTATNVEDILTEIAVDQAAQDAAIALNTAKVSAATQTGTGTDLNMSGKYQYNFGAASSATTFTMTSIAVGGYAECLINTTTEPVVTGATKLPNTASWITGTNMVLCVKDFNGTRKFWFVEF